MVKGSKQIPHSSSTSASVRSLGETAGASTYGSKGRESPAAGVASSRRPSTVSRYRRGLRGPSVDGPAWGACCPVSFSVFSC